MTYEYSIYVHEREGERTYLRQLANSIENLGSQRRSEALEVAGTVDVLGPAGLELLEGVLQGTLGSAVLELDNVVAGDQLGCPRLDDGCREGKGEEGSPEELHGGDGAGVLFGWVLLVRSGSGDAQGLWLWL